MLLTLYCFIPNNKKERTSFMSNKFTREDLIAYHRDITSRGLLIIESKNHDYTAGNSDTFANFSKAETLGICDTETGFLIRMSDKFSRIITFAKRGILKVSDESFEDTLVDFINYLILFGAYIKSKRLEGQQVTDNISNSNTENKTSKKITPPSSTKFISPKSSAKA